jgi:hypothetical protein
VVVSSSSLAGVSPVRVARWPGSRLPVSGKRPALKRSVKYVVNLVRPSVAGMIGGLISVGEAGLMAAVVPSCKGFR